ncbi:hypothetical protein N752_00605 [Desulforamulus aquiferis]|nr:hypothetical protein N752_00605 [Desulforamulus aquiferis]
MAGCVEGHCLWPAGGVIASYLMLVIGLTLSGSGLLYLWPLAILLMLIDARFLCFAYAGGILAFSSLVFGWPNVSVPQVLGLVAILHMVEAFLIYVSGHQGAVPTFIKNTEGKVVGGFALQKFWPIPLTAWWWLGRLPCLTAVWVCPSGGPLSREAW